ncbi:MAG: Gfo/Idh/MocA family oxidoreductase [Methylococcales bacterium]
MDTKIRLGLVGMGNQGQEYLRAEKYCQQVKIIAAYDTSPTIQQKISSNYPDITIVESLVQLQAQRLDGLILALPHHCYDEIWQELLAFNCPLLKEKPLGRNIKEAQHFINTAKEQGCPIQTAIQRRQHPSYIFLKDQLKNQTITELRAHLHLGFAIELDSPNTWRSDRKTSGGGALLDSGYHLIDLTHYLIGQFELINACLWDGDKLIQAESDSVESEAILLGRQGSTWVKIESKVSGEACANSKTGYKKSEAIEIVTTENSYLANREGVWKNNQPIFHCQRDWEKAIAQQIDDFANNITHNHWNNRIIWDQLPAMQMIERAYSLVFTA